MSKAGSQVPRRLTCGAKCPVMGPEMVAASEIAPTSTSPAAASSRTAAARLAAPTWERRSASPTSTPAGTHATTRRGRGWASPLASCSKGSAPGTSGPTASQPAVRSRYSHPVPATKARATDAQPATARRRRCP